MNANEEGADSIEEYLYDIFSTSLFLFPLNLNKPLNPHP
ncbi:hypothetical protein NTE_03483 [Candidatus Nitrososphaera evergladensis SR1]|uniref:Uncharacterized protein n=1 Tax=Candidatus Nitrososphaera evergladensis SR1 TaxID=1459636 RepID=A0A075MV29_9ARCH|nr:hypothetical protein NTE_03483 [Candidatus Nitrososphaera evergladensis SR1]